MTPQELDDKIWKQENAFSIYGREWDRFVRLNPSSKPGYEKFRNYLNSNWSRFMTAWIRDYSEGCITDVTPWETWFRAVQKSSSKFGIPQNTLIGADMITTHDHRTLMEFRKLCGAQLLLNENGEDPILCVFCNHKGKIYKRCIQLAPIIKEIFYKLKSAGKNLHREMGAELDEAFNEGFDTGVRDGIDALEDVEGGDTQIQGWWDDAKRTARHVADAKATKELFHDVKSAASNPMLQKGAASFIPGAGAAMQIHDMITSAKAGNRKSLAKLHEMKHDAKKGDKSAHQALKTAKNINIMLNLKAELNPLSMFEEEIGGWLYNKPYRSNFDTISDGMGGKFPTVGLTMRDAYNKPNDILLAKNRKKIGNYF